MAEYVSDMGFYDGNLEEGKEELWSAAAAKRDIGHAVNSLKRPKH
jgi:hypothetical protein